jgi:HAD superfamily hydrolase (TIGR01509 family)
VSTQTSPGRSAVLLDIDGTLVDSTYHHALAWARAFTRERLTVPLWEVHRAVGMGGDKLVAHVAGAEVEDRHGDALREGWEEEYAELIAEVQPLDGAARLVKELADAGWTVALASSGKRKFSDEAVRMLGIEDAVSVVTSADDAEESKPQPDLLHATLQQLDVDRAVFVGDTPYDVDAAGRAGLRCVGLLTGGFSRAELEEAGAAHVAESPGDLLDLDWTALLRRPGD